MKTEHFTSTRKEAMKDHGSENKPWRLLAAVVIAAAAIGLALLLQSLCTTVRSR